MTIELENNDAPRLVFVVCARVWPNMMESKPHEGTILFIQIPQQAHEPLGAFRSEMLRPDSNTTPQLLAWGCHRHQYNHHLLCEISSLASEARDAEVCAHLSSPLPIRC